MIYEVTTTDQADADLRDIAFELLSPDKEAGVVTVIRVIYAGRNVDNQLKNHMVM